MSLQQLIALLPCYSLEDLSLNRDGRESNELLSAWSSLFHPLLLTATKSVPKWERADLPPKEPANCLITIPACSEAMLPDGWLDEARTAGGHVICDLRHRDRVVAAAIERLEGPRPDVDPGLVADFLSLGFCHFQIELLTRQLRYMSNLDEVQFDRETIAAAESAVQGDAETARTRLGAAFDLLTESREYFYPVETYLLDLTLVAPTTIGEPLRAELELSTGHTNLLISGQTVQKMAIEEPNTLAALRQALEEGRASIIGGEFDEQELPLLGVEAILDQFRRGSNSYDRYLERRPKIFGRRRFGLTPVLPQLLDQLGFTGAVHFTLDDGHFPSGNHSKIRWQGVGSAEVDSLVRLPIDAALHESFLRLPEKLGDVMDLDHAATAVFAHWPGRSVPWYGDLRRMAPYSPVLGRFVSIADYFQSTEHSGQRVRYKADQYRSPYLKQAVAAGQIDPISRWVQYYGRRAAADAETAMAALADMVRPTGPQVPPGENLLRAVEDSKSSDSASAAGLDDRISGRIRQTSERLAAALPREDTEPTNGIMLTNSSSFARRRCVDVSALDNLPDVAAPVVDTAESAGRKYAVVDVPPMGFAWVAAGSASSPRVKKTPRKKGIWRKKVEEPPLAEENMLRNEFFEVTVDPITGAIRSLHDYHTRGNRLAQQIAYRFPRSDHPPAAGSGDDDTGTVYSVMAADDVSVTSDGPLVGEITSRGRLLDREGRRLAGFVQTTKVQRRSRVIEVVIELDVDRKPGPSPWDSYYAARFAWGDATVDLFRSLSLTSSASDAARIEAPHFVDLRSGKTQTTILTAGLPYHRRFGLRKLDTLLVVDGETARSFRFGIGIDLVHPVPAALDMITPLDATAEKAPPPSPSSGWMFHLDAKNVVATHWSPKMLGSKLTGFSVRLLETEGRSTAAALRSFKKVKSARKTSLAKGSPTELTVEGDRIKIDIAANQWVQVEAEFA